MCSVVVEKEERGPFFCFSFFGIMCVILCWYKFYVGLYAGLTSVGFGGKQMGGEPTAKSP